MRGYRDNYAISRRMERDEEREPSVYRATRHDYSRRRAQACRWADIMCGAITEPDDVEAANDECDHEALKADPARWSELEYVGEQPDYDDDGNPAPLELRNCSCGSTLARRAAPVEKPPPVVPVEPEWRPSDRSAS